MIASRLNNKYVGVKCETLSSGLVRGTGCSYYFFSAWLQRFFQDDANCNHLPYLQFFDPLSWRVSYIIYPLLVDFGPLFVDHVGCYSSACPICRLPKPSMSCSNQGSTAQGLFPH